MVDAFPKVTFLLVGGTREQIESLRNLANEVGVEKFFVFATRQPIEHIPDFLRLADVLVSPRSEGTNTPLKVYSYLRSGKPIVATDLPTHRQVLSDELAILVKPEPRHIAKGLLSFLKDDGLRKEFSQRCREFADENYSDEAFVQKVGEVYSYLGD